MQDEKRLQKRQLTGWVLLAVYFIAALAPLGVRAVSGQTLFGMIILLNLIFSVYVAVLFFGIKDMLIFYLISFVCTILLENLSIAVGVPFGYFIHYMPGPRILEVPLAVGMGYFYYATLGWIFADLIIGKQGRRTRLTGMLGRPLIGMIVASALDAMIDPIGSLVFGQWEYPYGGGFFGVPFSNSLGWFTNIFLILLLFEVFMMRRKDRNGRPDYAGTVSVWHLQTCILLGMQALPLFVLFFREPDAVLTDCVGTVWSSSDLYETVSLLALHTAVFFLIVGIFTYIRRKDMEVAEER